NMPIELDDGRSDCAYGEGQDEPTILDQTNQGAFQHENRDTHFMRKILVSTGPCIRLSLPALKLFERVHLVLYRSSEWTEKSLITMILARISKRIFPKFIVSRSANIFANGAVLLEFEAALRTQFHIDNILEFNGPPGKEEYEE